MDPATQADLNVIKDAILAELDDVRAIYLFGSVAKGTEKDGSDYDVLILVRKSPVDKIKRMADIRYAVEEKIKRPLEPHMMDLDDLNYASPILYEVYHNNKLLYGENVIGKLSEIVKKIKPHRSHGKIVDYHVEH
jgi:predicted nucleotidyltransferase